MKNIILMDIECVIQKTGQNTVLNELSKVTGTGLKAMLKLEKTNCKFIYKFDAIKKLLYN